MVVLGKLAGSVGASHAAFVAADALPRLVELLQSDSESSRGKAVVVLANLALEDPDLQVRIAAAGAIGPLVGLLASDLEAMQVSAATALGNMTFNASLHARFSSAGAFAPLSRLLQSKSAAVQQPAARALMGLANQNDAQAARAIAAAGGIPPLVHLLRSDSISATAMQMLALSVLTTLAAADGSPQRDISIMKNAGALPLLEKLKGNVIASAFIREDAASLLQLLQQSSSATPSAQRANEDSVAPPPSSSAYSVSSSSASPSFSTPATAAAIAAVPTITPAPTAAAAGPTPSSAPGAAGGSRQSDGRANKLCWSCGATGVPLKKCSVCAAAAYCGAVCQKADWKAHKGQCAGIKAARPKAHHQRGEK